MSQYLKDYLLSMAIVAGVFIALFGSVAIMMVIDNYI